MSPLNYTIKRLQTFLNEISILLESEFPYKHSELALRILQASFKKELSRLKKCHPASNKDIVNLQCSRIQNELFIYLPILGFILRSTNVRNAFEVFWPILRLAGDILEPGDDMDKRKTKLILSSEWDYSPYLYRELPRLPGFALIGLPAPESSNPLLIPLSGHELGHLLWVKNRLRNHITDPIIDAINKIVHDEEGKFLDHFPSFSSLPDDLSEDIFIWPILAKSQAWALRHAEESFSDIFGLRIFGSSFLQAFCYLLSPKVSQQRSLTYPKISTRAANLKKAAERFNITVPENYLDCFEDDEDPMLTQADSFLLSVTDRTLEEIIPPLLDKVAEILSEQLLPKSSEKETIRIYNRLKQVVPTENTQSIVDILNAAWMAFEETDLWKELPQVVDRRDPILKEIVLKNIEIYEIEQRLVEVG